MSAVAFAASHCGRSEAKRNSLADAHVSEMQTWMEALLGPPSSPHGEQERITASCSPSQSGGRWLPCSSGSGGGATTAECSEGYPGSKEGGAAGESVVLLRMQPRRGISRSIQTDLGQMQEHVLPGLPPFTGLCWTGLSPLPPAGERPGVALAAASRYDAVKRVRFERDKLGLVIIKVGVRCMYGQLSCGIFLVCMWGGDGWM